jgi:DNA primase
LISKASIQTIIDTARIEDVVGDYVSLKRRGINMIGLCPFHNERSPSFTVSPNKGIYKCFGCGKAGNSVNFLMEHEHFTYPEALRFLATKYQIPIEETVDTKQSKEEEKALESLFIINNFATEYFTRNLIETEEGISIGGSYFKERGFRKDTIEKFNLGYAINSYNAFSTEALKKGYQKELLQQAGLISENDRGIVDFFRGRVMFPIHNLSGKVIAFGGRIMEKNAKTAKYINSPETSIYNKSKTLYGMHLARNSVRQKDECLLVEGYVDVITMHQAGFENVVASSGTSLTVEQVKLINRFTQNLTILYDGDSAGIKASMRGIEIALNEGLNVRVCSIPDGDDPDSYLIKHGASAMQNLLLINSKNFLHFQAESLLANAGNDPVRKADVVNEVVKNISLITDPIKRSLFTQDLSHIIHISEEVLIRQVNKVRKNQVQKSLGMNSHESNDLMSYSTKETYNEAQQTFSLAGELLERDIIRILIECGDKEYDKDHTVASFLYSELKGLAWSDKAAEWIYNEFVNGLHNSQLPTHHDLMMKEDKAIQKTIEDIVTEKYSLSPNWQDMHEIHTLEKDKNYKRDIENVLNRFKLFHIELLIKQNNEELKQAEKEKNNVKLEECIRVKINLDNYRKDIAKKNGIVVSGIRL